ncbi:MAG: 4-hydroxy-tetrahydrodipicolinate synthase [Planctomycetota bacterium]
MTFLLQGALTALVTPFRDGQVDHDRLRKNIDFQINHGIDGLVPVGTTGESPTLSHDEHDAVIATTVEQTHGRVPVVAGTGSNATDEALRLTQHAQRVGATAALMVNPYYNKPSQEGLYRHFITVADAVDLPIVLYNIPGRTNVTMTPATVARLAAHPNIVAIKEATGSLDIASEILTLTNPKEFTLVSGDDSLTLPLMAIGGQGVISVLANLLPDHVKALTAAAQAGDYATARQHHLDLFTLCRGMLTLDTNPIPIKTALALRHQDTGNLRLPLVPMDNDKTQQLQTLLQHHNLLPQTT